MKEASVILYIYPDAFFALGPPIGRIPRRLVFIGLAAHKTSPPFVFYFHQNMMGLVNNFYFYKKISLFSLQQR